MVEEGGVKAEATQEQSEFVNYILWQSRLGGRYEIPCESQDEITIFRDLPSAGNTPDGIRLDANTAEEWYFCLAEIAFEGSDDPAFLACLAKWVLLVGRMPSKEQRVGIARYIEHGPDEASPSSFRPVDTAENSKTTGSNTAQPQAGDEAAN